MHGRLDKFMQQLLIDDADSGFFVRRDRAYVKSFAGVNTARTEQK